MTGARRVLPGYRLSLGVSLVYLGAIVALPLLGLVARAGAGWTHAGMLADPRTLSAFRVSLLSAGGAALISAALGLLLAWVLERYRFAGRRLLDASIDLPFALPTAVAGIALTALYVPDGWLGRPLAWAGIGVAFTPAGIGVALVFVGLPFVVRTVQPVLAALDRAAEEAALIMDASALAIFRRVVLPPLLPALAAGTALAFARGVGEYGSVIFIAGNRPGYSEILPLLIVIKLDQYDYPGAAVLGTAMLALSALLLIVIDRLQSAARVR